MRWRRLIRNVLIFGVLGALVNLAVAWGIAMWTTVPSSMPGGVGTVHVKTPWRAPPPEGFPAHAMAYDRWVGVGIERLDQDAGANTADAIAAKRAKIATNQATRPAVAVLLNMALDHLFVEDAERNYGVSITQAGWPLLAFEGFRFRRHQTMPLTPPTVWVSWAIESSANPITGVTGGIQRRLLPLRPMTLGFIVNSLLYGIALWLLVAGPLAFIRWRRRRRIGHCATCGYDLRGATHERCPECGAPIADVQAAG